MVHEPLPVRSPEGRDDGVAEAARGPFASALRPGALSRLPDCFIATCEYDPLRDEAEAYGDALRANGVHVETKRYDGLIHAAATLGGVLDGGRLLVADVAAHLRKALHG